MNRLKILALAFSVGALVACGKTEEPKPGVTPPANTPPTVGPGPTPDAGGEPPIPSPPDTPPQPPAETQEAEGLMKQVMDYIKQRKPELAKAALDKLEAMKTKLSPALQEALKKAQAAFAALKAAGG